MKINDLIKDMVIGIAVPVFVGVVGGLIPKDKLRELCFEAGKAVSSGMRKQIGEPWEKLEGLAQDTLDIAYDGFIEGLDSDDGTT